MDGNRVSMSRCRAIGDLVKVRTNFYDIGKLETIMTARGRNRNEGVIEVTRRENSKTWKLLNRGRQA